VNETSGFLWIQDFQDGGYQYGGDDPKTLVHRPGRLLLVDPGHRRAVRVYEVGVGSLAFAGEIPYENDSIYSTNAHSYPVAWHAPGDERIIVVNDEGVLQEYGVWPTANGNVSLLSIGDPQYLQTSFPPVLQGAHMLYDWDMLQERDDSRYRPGDRLVWWISGYEYAQLANTSSRPLLGGPGDEWFYAVSHGQALAERLLVVRVRSQRSGLRVYHHPGAGGNQSWHELQYVPSLGVVGAPYEFPDPNPKIDIWSFCDYHDYVPGGPIYLVTMDRVAAKVRRLRLTPDLASFTFKVTQTSFRDVDVRDVAWYRSTSGARRHIELTPDGTLRLVSYRWPFGNYF